MKNTTQQPLKRKWTGPKPNVGISIRFIRVNHVLRSEKTFKFQDPEPVIENCFSYFSTKTYDVSTQKHHLNETQNIYV